MAWSPCFQGFLEPVGVLSSVSRQPFRLGKATQHGWGADPGAPPCSDVNAGVGEQGGPGEARAPTNRNYPRSSYAAKKTMACMVLVMGPSPKRAFRAASAAFVAASSPAALRASTSAPSGEP